MARTENSGWLTTRVAFAAASLIAGGALVASTVAFAPVAALADEADAAAQSEAVEPQSEDKINDPGADEGGHLTVYLDANNGSGETKYGNTNLVDGAYTVPECPFESVDNREFLCWSTTPTGEGGKMLSPGEMFGDFNAEFTLYALWEDPNDEEAAGDITVSFDANGGTGTMAPQYCWLKDGAFTAPECEFNPPTDDLEFVGWSLESSDGSTAVLYQPGETIEDFNDDFTLYATWSEKDAEGDVKVSFDANGGVGTMADQYCWLKDGFFTAPECTFKPITDDLEFKGWSLYANDGSATLYQPGDKIEDFNDDFTLHATWGAKAGNIIVTFDANGGTGHMDNDSTTLVAGIYQLPECYFNAPAGKVFKGWSLEKDGSGKLYQPGDNFEDFNDSFTLYAIWGDASSAATNGTTDQKSAIAKTADATDYAPAAAVAGLGATLVAAAALAFRKVFKR